MRHFGLTLLIVCLIAGTAPAGKFNRKLSIGDAAPRWKSLPGIDARNHAFDEYAAADVLVVAFICDRCPVTRAYERRFIDFAAKYHARNVRFVAVSCSLPAVDALDRMKQHAREHDFNFPYLHDPSQNTGRLYGASVTPHIFVLDKSRNVRYMGAYDDSMIESKIEERYVPDVTEALLAGREIDVTESRQRGCEIRYRSAE